MLASMMLEEGVIQAAWGGNTDTYTNTLCSPQLREHCRSRDDKNWRMGRSAERLLSSGRSIGIALMSSW